MGAAPMRYERADGQRVESLSGHESTSGAHGHQELRIGLAPWAAHDQRELIGSVPEQHERGMGVAPVE